MGKGVDAWLAGNVVFDDAVLFVIFATILRVKVVSLVRLLSLKESHSRIRYDNFVSQTPKLFV